MQVCARLCLEQRVVGGVHDGEPVLAESRAVCPSEVTHELKNKEQKRKKKCIKITAVISEQVQCVEGIACWPPPPYLDAVLHVLFAGLLLHHL